MRIYNSTIDSLKAVEPSKAWKHLDETPEEDLVENLCMFLKSVTKPDGSLYNSSSLQTFLNALSRYLINSRDIDIKKDSQFRKIRDILKTRTNESHNMGQLPGIHGSTPLMEDDLKKALSSGTIGRNNPLSLITLVQFCLLKSTNAVEIHDILNGDFDLGPSNENGFPEFITLTHRVSRHNAKVKKSFITLDSKSPDLCPVRNILFYMSKKTPEQSKSDQPFFLGVMHGSLTRPKGDAWYFDHRLGKNPFGNLLKKALVKAGVDLTGQKITPRSVRMVTNFKS